MVRKFFLFSILFVLAACGDESHPTAPTAPDLGWATLKPPIAHLRVGESMTFRVDSGNIPGNVCPLLIANKPSSGPSPSLFMRLEQVPDSPWLWKVTVTKSPQDVYTGGAVPDPYEVFFFILGGKGLCSQRPIGNSIGEARIYVHQ